MKHPCGLSPSSRRAWIEIFLCKGKAKENGVALLAEGVDRNVHIVGESTVELWVALLPEGVDRNSK